MEWKGSNRFKSINLLFEIFCYFIFWITPQGVWKILDIWKSEEWTNEIFTQGTNIIFEKHFEAIWFSPKHIKI